MSTSKLCYWSTSKLCYLSTSKLCYMSTSKLGRPIVWPPHSFVFLMRLHPMVWPPLHPRPPPAHGRGDAPAAAPPAIARPAATPTSSNSGRRRSRWQPPPLTRGATTIAGNNPSIDDATVPLPPHLATRPAPPLAPPPPSAFSPSLDSSWWHLRLGLRLR
jgi:hypothetical protein